MARGKARDSSDEDDFVDRTFECGEEEAMEMYTYADRVVSRMEELGVGDAPRPRLEEEHGGIFSGLKPGQYFNGGLPTVIRKLSLDQISSLLSLFTNWYTYVLQQTMKVETELSEAKKQKDLMWAMVRTRIKDSATAQGRTISDARVSDLAKIDQRFVKADARHAELDALYKCMSAMLKSAGHNLKTVSRDVTVRQVIVESESVHRGLSNRNPSRFGASYRGPVAEEAELPGLEREDEEDEGDVEEPPKGRVPSKARPPLRGPIHPARKNK